MQTAEVKSPSTPPATDFEFTVTKLSGVKAKGKPAKVPWHTKGLLTQGGMSVLGAKPKQGKSSMARLFAVCTAKGTPFLGMETIKGDVLMLNLEDPIFHVANCMDALAGC